MIRKTIIIFINHLEKKIRTDVRYVLKGFFWLGSGHIITIFAGLATSVAFANLLSPETYGTFKYALSLMPFLEIAILAGLNNSLTISVAKGFEGDVLNVLKTKIKWGLFGTMAGFFLTIYYYLYNKELAPLVAIISIFVPFFNTPVIYGSFLLGRKKFKAISIFSSISSGIYAVAIITTILLSKNILFILISYLAVNTLIRFGIFLYILKTESFNDKQGKDTIAYGKKISVLEVVNTIASSLDNILVFHYLGAVELAAYTFIKKVPEHIKFVPRFLTDLSTPKFSSKDIGDPFIKKEVIRKTIIFYSGIAGLVAIYILFAPFIFKIFFYPYRQYVFLSQIYAISFALNFGGLFLNFVESNRKAKSVIGVNLSNSCLTIVVVFLSLKLYGLTGLIVGHSIIRFTSSWIRYFYFKRSIS